MIGWPALAKNLMIVSGVGRPSLNSRYLISLTEIVQLETPTIAGTDNSQLREAGRAHGQGGGQGQKEGGR